MREGIDCIGVGVSFFCHDDNGNVVMAKRGKNCRDEHGVWDIGSGAVKMFHAVEETLKNEITEEYCATIFGFEFLGTRATFRLINDEKTHWIFFDFKVSVDPFTVKNGEPHKFDEVRFFPIDAMPKEEEMHSQIPNFLKKYHKQLFK